MLEEIMTAEEVAKYFGVGTKTITERWAKKPEFPKAVLLPAGDAGRSSKRYRKRDIEGYVNNQF